MLSRKDLLKSLLLAGVGSATPLAFGQTGAKPESEAITLEDLKSFEKVAGISFTDAERKEILSSVSGSRRGFEAIRKLPIDYTTEPRTVFTPIGGGSEDHPKVVARPTGTKGLDLKKMSDEDIAFLSVRELGSLIRSKQLSPVRLTEIYLDRLKRYGDKLLCVVTLTEDRARRAARQAEQEIAAGHYRGPLHGIPYGIKDLFAVKGYPTTWGANTFEHQSFDYDATVVQKLDAAGAILLAKLSMGALALGDVWFRGTTKNPFNPSQGSSGSSAGSAAGTAAGLVAFAIGTETLGSVVSPSTRCRVTGLRPTYGRTSRHGGMALSYTMDKVGVICRQAEDTALVLAQICGADPLDPSAVSRSFVWPASIDPKKLKIAYTVGPNVELTDRSGIEKDPALLALQRLGAQLQPARFTPVPSGLLNVLNVESSSAFDAFTLGEQIRELTNSPWPQTFRAARYVPAPEYLQMQRARSLAMEQFEKEMGDFDAVLSQGTSGQLLITTNLTGTPQIALPWGADASNNSISRVLTGRNYQEAKLVAIAKLVQGSADFHHLRPDLSKF
ncbi:MAG TPA: amidase [Fimbriimonadaceae bacterium]|nr:amidase [Fimbriimonadaceae bacterium]